jgi:D-alanine-D-alanine ligase-like ATP-grasp enzyme
VFSPIRLLEFKPDRGKVYQGQPMSKLKEMQRLAAAGLPVPKFEEIRAETVLSVEDYGPYVVVKPSDAFASWGAGIELRRTQEVRYRSPGDYPEGHPGRKAPMVAQKFIHCGKAMTCRVLTLFGATLFTYCRESTRELALDPAKPTYEPADFMPSPPDRIAYVARDPDVLTLAAAAYRAMPEAALQACDILRDADGGLHLLEINPGGGTWMLSSEHASGYREALGFTDLAAEFDAFRVCARELIARTRAEAT